MENGLNDLAGGKPFNTSVILDNGYKPNCHEKDIEDYKGEWCIMLITKDKHKGYSRERYNSKEDTQQGIDKLMSGKDTANNIFGGDLDIKDISLIIPMPIS